MTDIRKTIEPKSDRLNADDLIGRDSITINVTKVSLAAGEQPVAISYDGDNNKPFYPCKSMRRVLVTCWGPDGNAYIGRSMTLYRDEKVRFGADEVGGIRISHLSHIKEPVTIALTASRAKRKPFVVRPLETQQKAMQTAETGSEEVISTDQVTVLADLLQDKDIDKTRLLTAASKALGQPVGSLATLPLPFYERAVKWVEQQAVA